jgi:hypothetical protein
MTLIPRGADTPLDRPGRKQTRKHVRRRERFQQHRDASCHQNFFNPQGKAPKEIQAILTEILACCLPGRGKDLSAPMEDTEHMKGAEGNSQHSDRNISLFPFWSG